MLWKCFGFKILKFDTQPKMTSNNSSANHRGILSPKRMEHVETCQAVASKHVLRILSTQYQNKKQSI